MVHVMFRKDLFILQQQHCNIQLDNMGHPHTLQTQDKCVDNMQHCFEIDIPNLINLRLVDLVLCEEMKIYCIYLLQNAYSFSTFTHSPNYILSGFLLLM